MIIDRILDRKDGEPYDPREFYYDMLEYEHTFDFEGSGIKISKAMDYGEEEDVKRELCKYIDMMHYSADIKDYIKSVNWLEEDDE